MEMEDKTYILKMEDIITELLQLAKELVDSEKDADRLQTISDKYDVAFNLYYF